MYTKLYRAPLALIFIMSAGGLLFAPGARAGERLVAEDFSRARVGGAVPPGWESKVNKGRAGITITEEGGDKVLHLKSEGSSFGLKKEITVDLNKYPVFSWRWKAVKLPEGGDVRRKETDDQGAQIYLHFASFPAKINFWMIGYIWDSLAPKGGAFPSSNVFGSRVQYIVLQSGKDRLGKWIKERRNVYDDHKRLFGKPPPKLTGIAVMIDSDNTNTNAECYIDDLVFEAQ